MNLADPELELIDPTPNVHNLFLNFDKIFFWDKLASRVVVRWSKRMYSCAGVCSYERRCGFCDIALSEPLLKLRPRKDLVETLLHEMIHAYLFITCRDNNRDGHGPNFQAHMHRINRSAGLNITIYHSFHDEVAVYQTHWWRCNGPCQTRKPHFGIIRRPVNRAPGKYDYWWEDHNRKCGGTFIKIKEPEKPGQKHAKPKPKADITKYINTQNVPSKTILKDSNRIPVKTKINSGNTLIITKKGSVTNTQTNKSPLHNDVKSPVLFGGTGKTIGSDRPTSNSVTETVRNLWANKQLPLTPNAATKQTTNKPSNTNITLFATPIYIPPTKIKKIDDYFKNSASTSLKDLYGQDFKVTQLSGDLKFTAVLVTMNNSKKSLQDVPKILVEDSNLVTCPVCSAKINSKDINKHLDECLNKEVIEVLCKDNLVQSPSNITVENDTNFIRPNNVINQNWTPEILNKTINQFTEFEKGEIIKEELIDFNSNKVKETNRVNSETLQGVQIKVEPGTSKTADHQKCACCGNVVDKPLEQHLEECLAFFSNNTTIPEEGASTSFTNEIIVLSDEDDMFDESSTLNATITKTPCPCCLEMIATTDMNEHLDQCLS